MPLELATALIKVKVDERQLQGELDKTRKQIARELSRVKVKVEIDAQALARSAAQAGAQAGRQARIAFQQSFRTASPMGPAGLLGGPTTQVGPKTFLIGGPHTGQRRLGQTFFSGSAQPTFGSGGVPH